MRLLGLPSKVASGETSIRAALHGVGVEMAAEDGNDELPWAEFRDLLSKREERRRRLLRSQIAGGAGGGI